MPGELLVAGRVADVGERIATLRAQERERRGWIFDTYLLSERERRPGPR
jgi:precorrin-6A synthase